MWITLYMPSQMTLKWNTYAAAVSGSAHHRRRYLFTMRLWWTGNIGVVIVWLSKRSRLLRQRWWSLIVFSNCGSDRWLSQSCDSYRFWCLLIRTKSNFCVWSAWSCRGQLDSTTDRPTYTQIYRCFQTNSTNNNACKMFETARVRQ